MRHPPEASIAAVMPSANFQLQGVSAFGYPGRLDRSDSACPVRPSTQRSAAPHPASTILSERSRQLSAASGRLQPLQGSIFSPRSINASPMSASRCVLPVPGPATSRSAAFRCQLSGTMMAEGRGRDRDYSPPPAQIRTCGTTAYGSCLES